MGKVKRLKRERRVETLREQQLVETNEGLMQVLFVFGGKVFKREFKPTLTELRQMKMMLDGSDLDTACQSISVAQTFWVGRRFIEGVLREGYECYQNSVAQTNKGSPNEAGTSIGPDGKNSDAVESSRVQQSPADGIALRQDSGASGNSGRASECISPSRTNECSTPTSENADSGPANGEATERKHRLMIFQCKKCGWKMNRYTSGPHRCTECDSQYVEECK